MTARSASSEALVLEDFDGLGEALTVDGELDHVGAGRNSIVSATTTSAATSSATAAGAAGIRRSTLSATTTATTTTATTATATAASTAAAKHRRDRDSTRHDECPAPSIRQTCTAFGPGRRALRPSRRLRQP